MGKYWKPLREISSWRKMSIGMWGAPNDPTIYGHETMNVEKTVPYLEQLSEASGVRISMTALMVASIAKVFGEHPTLNVIVVNGRIQQRNSVDSFCQVAIPNEETGKADLSGVKISNVDTLDLVQVSERLRSRAKKVRAGQDAEIERSKATVDFVPSWLMRPVIRFFGFLTFNVPIDLDFVGLRSDPFGSFMVSSISQFDLILGYAPLVPASRCPLVALPGKVHDVVLPIDGEPKVVKGLTVGVTFDHRCFDGYQIGIIVRRLRELIQDPETYFGSPHQFGEVIPAEPRRPEDPARAAQ